MNIADKTQMIRERIIDDIVNNDKGLPASNEDTLLLLEIMRDADRTELAKRKISSDDKNAEQDRDLATAYLRLQRQNRGAGNRFEVTDGLTIEHEAPVSADVALLPIINPLDENMAVGISTQTYDDFAAIHES